MNMPALRPPAHIAVATDFSPGAALALDRAITLAVEHSAGLSLVHALALPSWREGPRADLRHALDEQVYVDAAHALLEPLARQARDAGVASVQVSVLPGRLHMQLDMAPLAGADLLVMGARGEGALPELPLRLGSELHRCLQRWPGPLLAVRQPAGAAWQRVLDATDFSPQALHAVRTALKLAPLARHQLLHMLAPPPASWLPLPKASETARDALAREAAVDARHALESLAAELSIGRERALVPMLREGRPSTCLLEVAKSEQAELIALGALGGSRLEAGLLGSLGLHALAEAPCDVLLVRLSGSEAGLLPALP
ncbi:MAG: universal stress protein [Aquimonas sp.]|nr:universal stress protein [Aquimonas sp.]